MKYFRPRSASSPSELRFCYQACRLIAKCRLRSIAWLLLSRPSLSWGYCGRKSAISTARFTVARLRRTQARVRMLMLTLVVIGTKATTIRRHTTIREPARATSIRLRLRRRYHPVPLTLSTAQEPRFAASSFLTSPASDLTRLR